MPSRTESVAAAIKRLLGIEPEHTQALMPHGEHSTQHYVGGYTPEQGVSWAEEAYERDTADWTVISGPA